MEYVWGGTLGFAFDLMSYVGQTDGLYYLLGYAGHGVAMGTYMGKIVVEALLHKTIREHPFVAFPFPNPPLGLYWKKPWFLPMIGIWHRILDVIE